MHAQFLLCASASLRELIWFRPKAGLCKFQGTVLGGSGKLRFSSPAAATRLPDYFHRHLRHWTGPMTERPSHAHYVHSIFGFAAMNLPPRTPYKIKNGTISARIGDKTMTVERLLRGIAGFFILISVLLAHYHSAWWLLFTAFVGLNLLQSAFTDWCPMMAVLKKCKYKSQGQQSPAV